MNTYFSMAKSHYLQVDVRVPFVAVVRLRIFNYDYAFYDIFRSLLFQGPLPAKTGFPGT